MSVAELTPQTHIPSHLAPQWGAVQVEDAARVAVDRCADILVRADPAAGEGIGVVSPVVLRLFLYVSPVRR